MAARFFVFYVSRAGGIDDDDDHHHHHHHPHPHDHRYHAAGAGALTDSHRQEMAAFVAAELVTPDWMRALSILDAAANVSAFRPDHGAIGSYDAWPAQVRWRRQRRRWWW